MDDEIKELKQKIIASEQEKSELKEQIDEINEIIAELQTLAKTDKIDMEKKKQIIGDLTISKKERIRLVLLSEKYIELLKTTVSLKETIIKQQEEIILLQEKQMKLEEILDVQKRKHAELVQELAEKHETVKYLKESKIKLKKQILKGHDKTQ